MFDVRIRMRVDEITLIVPHHLFSEIDSAANDTYPGTVEQTTRGSTEWATSGAHRLTFAWDWTCKNGSWRLQGRWTTLRTNLMVIDADGIDMGVDCVRLCVARLMTQAKWESMVANFLRLRNLH